MKGRWSTNELRAFGSRCKRLARFVELGAPDEVITLELELLRKALDGLGIATNPLRIVSIGRSETPIEDISGTANLLEEESDGKR